MKAAGQRWRARFGTTLEGRAGGLMEPLSGFRAYSVATQGRTVPGVKAGRFNPGLDYGILSGLPAIAEATIFVAP
jgi:hypothetical protein